MCIRDRFVIEAKETPQVNETGFFVAQRDENGLVNSWKNGIPNSWHNRGGWNCHNLPKQDYHIESFDEDTNTIYAVKNK